MRHLDEAVSSVVRARLDGAPSEPVRLSGEMWEAVRSRMFKGNVPGLLAAAVEAGDVSLDGAARDQLFHQLMVRLVNDLQVEDECIRVMEVLGEELIPTLVLKGLAVSHLDYPDPSHRSTTDVDLLIRAEDIERATAVLAPAGYRRELPERREGFDRRFAKDVTFYGPRGVQIDLHRTLLLGPFGAAIDLDELWGGHERLEVSGLPDRWALDAPSRLLHAAYTVVLADTRPSLGSLCDVAQLVLHPAMDWDLLRARAERWRSVSIVVDAVAAAAGATGMPLSAPFSDHHDSTEQRWRRMYEAQGGSLVATMIGTAAALEPFDAVRYVRDLSWPRRAYRQARRVAGRPSEFGAAVAAVRRRYGREPA